MRTLNMLNAALEASPRFCPLRQVLWEFFHLRPTKLAKPAIAMARLRSVKEIMRRQHPAPWKCSLRFFARNFSGCGQRFSRSWGAPLGCLAGAGIHNRQPFFDIRYMGLGRSGRTGGGARRWLEQQRESFASTDGSMAARGAAQPAPLAPPLWNVGPLSTVCLPLRLSFRPSSVQRPIVDDGHWWKADACSQNSYGTSEGRRWTGVCAACVGRTGRMQAEQLRAGRGCRAVWLRQHRMDAPRGKLLG